MTTILIRADASLLIGSGHVMRCRTLARELSRRGAKIIFICRKQPGDLIGLLEQEFQVYVLPSQLLTASELDELESLQGRELYAAMLGCSQEQDAVDCLQALSDSELNQVSWLIVDHYGLDISWETRMMTGFGVKSVPRLLVIDDLADRTHIADCLLDQNFFGAKTKKRYKGLVPSDCCQLLGPHYSLLGPEYAQLHPLVRFRTELKRVLVYFGGVDSSNLTCLALEALMAKSLADLAVDVVLPLHASNRQSVSNLVDLRPLTTLHEPLASLSGLITRADLAIGAGGSTTWERACLGLPCFVVTLAKNQVALSQELHKAGFIKLLGDKHSVNITSLSQAVQSAREKLQNIGSGYELTDGWGASRLATNLLGIEQPLNLKHAQDGDSLAELSYEYGGQDSNKSSSLTELSDDITNKYRSIDFNKSDQLLIVRDSAMCPLGKLSFTRDNSQYLEEQQKVKVDMRFESWTHHKTLSSLIIQLGLNAMESSYNIEGKMPETRDSLSTKRKFTYAKAERIGGANSEIPLTTMIDNSLALRSSFITILSDKSSWLNPYLTILIEALWNRGHYLRWIHNPNELGAGDICLLLSCSRLLTPEQLIMHRHNLVVHASNLPKGQGWSPMTWQILEGLNQIPLTLFEANEDLDTGVIYLQRLIKLHGTELVDEWRKLQAQATMELCLNWCDQYNKVIHHAHTQTGQSSFYERRRPHNSKLDIDRTIDEQFNLLRVADNLCYPAYFEKGGQEYEIHVHARPGSSL